MQFKLLQFYKCLSTFSTALIMNFVPLIIYEYGIIKWSTSFSMALAFGFLALSHLLVALFGWVLRKQLFKRPQVFLSLRIIPIIAMLVSVAFLYMNSIIIIICVAIFSAFNFVFSNIPQDAIYNFVSVDKNSKALGVTKFMMQVGYILAGIVGGLFLDKINETFVVIISLCLYVISALPLLVYYIKNRNKKGFNTESIATIVQLYENNDKTKTENVRKNFLKQNFLTYLLLGVTDQLYDFFSIIFFIKTGSYFLSGLILGIYDTLYAVMCLYAGYVLQKRDCKWLSFVCIIAMSIVWLPILIVNNVWVISILFLSNALAQPFFNLYIMQMFLDKSRILGVSNNQLLDMNNACFCSYSFCESFGLLGSFVPSVIASVVIAFIGAFYMIKAEKQTTKDLVTFLNQNEIVN